METVIFDCDGVLVDSEIIVENTLIDQLPHWLPDLQPEMLRATFGMTTANAISHLETRSTHRLPDNALALINDAIDLRLARELQPIKGVANAISRIDRPLAIASNSGRQRVVNSLATTGLDSWLDRTPIFSAEQVAAPKPAPDVYLLAAREMACPAIDCLVVEDSVPGVRAASAAGMTVIGFTGASHIRNDHGERLLEAGAWRILENMKFLESIIGHWSAQRAIGRSRT